jgi:hypothetical protein
MRYNPIIARTLAEIETAFADDEPPAYDQIVNRHQFRRDIESDNIREFLAGKRWQALTRAEFARYEGDMSAVLGFLTPEAFSYYLPAFLSVCLTDFDWADVTVESTFWRFSTDSDSRIQALRDRRIQALSIEQLDAVASTARALAVVHGPDKTYTNAIADVERAIRERGTGHI